MTTSISSQTAKCDACGLEKPLVLFPIDKRHPLGYAQPCRECKAAKKRDRWRAAVDRRISNLDAVGLGILEQITTGQKANPATFYSVPHLMTAMEEIMAVFGGPRGYAAQLLALYLSAAPGSNTRLQILKMINANNMFITEKGMVDIPTHLLTDRELEKMAHEADSVAPPKKHDGNLHGSVSDPAGPSAGGSQPAQTATS